jgi:O-antigen ligase
MRIQLGGRAAGLALLAAFLAIVFLMGGSARDDVISLVFLRPLGVMFLGAGLLLLPRQAWRENRLLIALALALPALTLIHLIPLPPALWEPLPGRELVREIGEAAGIGEPWRPISLVPFRSWNSFWAFLVPLAALALALGLQREQSRLLVFALAFVILASGVLGLLQSVGAPGNGFYLYRVTNDESAVGLFANRNHQAMLLAIAFPVVAAAASLSRGTREAVRPKLWLALGTGVMIVPFLLVTQSRAGLVVGAVGILSAPFVYRDPTAQLQPLRKTARVNYRWLGIGAVAAGLVLTTALVARASSLQRLLSGPADGGEDLRLRVWGPIADAAWSYFPVGSGIGTFVEVYKVIEPDENLSPLYLNHAHNDWLEMLLTGGLPAVLILAATIWLLGRAVLRALVTQRSDPSSEAVIARLGAAIVIILALGSAYDYPLRVPSLACLFAIAVVWLVRRHDSLKRPSP